MPAGEHRIISGRYPLTPDPDELQRCVLEHARDLDRNVEHHAAHARRIKALEDGHQTQADQLSDIQVRLAKLSGELRMTIAIGAGAIALLVPVLTRVLEWIAK